MYITQLMIVNTGEDDDPNKEMVTNNNYYCCHKCNETNMLPKGTRGHHDWLLNNSVTKVGFGYSGNVIVGKSN